MRAIATYVLSVCLSYVLVTTMCPAEMAELIEIMFGSQTCMVPRNHVAPPGDYVERSVLGAMWAVTAITVETCCCYVRLQFSKRQVCLCLSIKWSKILDELDKELKKRSIVISGLFRISERGATLPLPQPPSLLTFPSFLPLSPFRSRAFNPARWLREHCMLPQQVWQSLKGVESIRRSRREGMGGRMKSFLHMKQTPIPSWGREIWDVGNRCAGSLGLHDFSAFTALHFLPSLPSPLPSFLAP